MGKKKLIAFIPARAGSLRVASKNTRELAGHPLIAYSITVALESGLFDRVLVSTDSEVTRKIAIHYGAEAPFLRPEELATSKAIDAQWLEHAFSELEKLDGKMDYDAFAIVRPTSPFRTVEMLKRAAEQFLVTPGIDSIRAVELCQQHPGKMWKIQDGHLKPFLDQEAMEVPWHAMQYQDLPKVYVQNSSLEMAWSYVISKYHSREGKVIAPFLTEGHEGFSIDYEQDWTLAEALIASGKVRLPEIQKTSCLVKG